MRAAGAPEAKTQIVREDKRPETLVKEMETTWNVPVLREKKTGVLIANRDGGTRYVRVKKRRQITCRLFLACFLLDSASIYTE